MLTTIEGIYENGRVILSENPPSQAKTKVFITFLEDVENQFFQTVEQSQRILGTMKGTIKMSDDFNDAIDELENYAQ